jgi:hypothetical protein
LEASCQRCHETIREDDRYCRVCGLPQLTYVAADVPEAVSADEAMPMAGATREPFGLAGGIAWRPALRVAALFAVPAGLFFRQSAPLGLIWAMGAAAWAVSLYSKQSRSSRLSVGVGARIGLITGLFASWLALGFQGGYLWFERFVLHHGAQIDSDWSKQVEASVQFNQQTFAQMGMASAQVAQSTQMSKSLMMSVEGQGGYAVFILLVGAAFLLCFASIGGAIGARFLTQPRRPNV